MELDKHEICIPKKTLFYLYSHCLPIKVYLILSLTLDLKFFSFTLFAKGYFNNKYKRKISSLTKKLIMSLRILTFLGFTIALSIFKGKIKKLNNYCCKQNLCFFFYILFSKIKLITASNSSFSYQSKIIYHKENTKSLNCMVYFIFLIK